MMIFMMTNITDNVMMIIIMMIMMMMMILLDILLWTYITSIYFDTFHTTLYIFISICIYMFSDIVNTEYLIIIQL